MVLAALLLAAGASEGASDSREVVQACEILAAIERGEPIEYDDVIIEGDLDLRGRTLETVHFNHAIFRGSVNFEGTNFTGDAWFVGVNFGEDAKFGGAKFNVEDASFTASKFSGNAEFWRTKFNGDADFDLVEFTGSIANFYRAEFTGGDASFLLAKFTDSIANFDEARFGREANFWGAEFSDYIKFKEAKFDEDVDFREAKFGKDVDFVGAEFKEIARFSYASFDGSVIFNGAQFYKRTYFNSAIFKGSASFEDAQFSGNAYFENTTFRGDLNLNRAGYTRFFLCWDAISDSHLSASDYDAYLALMRNYVNLGWFEDSNNCYYEYRNKHRMDETNFIEKTTDIIEWVLYGYGVKPRRTVLWIVCLVFAFGMVFRNDGSIKKYVREKSEVPIEDGQAPGDKSGAVELKTTLRRAEINFKDPFLFSLTTFTSGLTSFLYPSIEYEAEKHTRLVIVERLLGSVFLALLITAISKTYLIR